MSSFFKVSNHGIEEQVDDLRNLSLLIARNSSPFTRNDEIPNLHCDVTSPYILFEEGFLKFKGSITDEWTFFNTKNVCGEENWEVFERRSIEDRKRKLFGSKTTSKFDESTPTAITWVKVEYRDCGSSLHAKTLACKLSLPPTRYAYYLCRLFRFELLSEAQQQYINTQLSDESSSSVESFEDITAMFEGILFGRLNLLQNPTDEELVTKYLINKNRGEETPLHFEEADIFGEPMSTLFSSRPIFQENVWYFYQTEQHSLFAMSLDGFWIQVNRVPIVDAKGSTIGTRCHKIFRVGNFDNWYPTCFEMDEYRLTPELLPNLQLEYSLCKLREHPEVEKNPEAEENPERHPEGLKK